MDQKYRKLAALGALGVCAGVLVTYAGIWWLGTTTPVAGAPGATGGIDSITRNVLWVAALVPAMLFIVTHLVFARQLNAGPRSLSE